ncbi:MAG TPA: hypothetical protein VJG49_04420 [Candidatus Nanoarchaeia archaeon]|nr:hypothetical protein [Candidatus Nanoarchaeia archaeon]
MEKRTKYILIAIFAVTLATRLVLAFLIPNLTYDSYFHLRQVEEISNTGLPLYQDPLSYGGRTLRFLPFFHYFMALFDLVLPIELIVKILPNLLLATLTITVFFIGKKISGNDDASLFSAAIVGFLPILFFTNTFSPLTLFLPLLFLNIYAFMNIKEPNYIYLYIASFLLLSFTSSATFLLIVGFGIYLLLSFIEGKRTARSELELIIFSLFFFIWIQFIFFKNVLVKQGIAFIWQNIPAQIIQEYFPQISIFQSLILVSIVPFLIGILVVYRSLFQLKGQKAFLLISFVISTIILAWLRLIEFKLALTFFGIILAILFVLFYQDASSYIRSTKLPRLKKYLTVILIVLLLLTTVYPAIKTALEQDTPKDHEIAAFQWLGQNTPENAAVLALLEEGHLVTYYAHRKNLIDDQFGLVKDVDKRFAAMNSLYITPFQTQALHLTDEYHIQYLTLTPTAQEKYGLDRFGYLTEECFELVHNQITKIYKVNCALT